MSMTPEFGAHRPGPPGTHDLRQNGRGPNDPMPEHHSRVLGALLVQIRSDMGEAQMGDLAHTLHMCRYWGFDEAILRKELQNADRMLSTDGIVTALRDEFSPHDFEKTTTLLMIAVDGRQLSPTLFDAFCYLAEASGHGAEALCEYLNQMTAMRRMMGIRSPNLS